jgi:GTP-binding protein
MLIDEVSITIKAGNGGNGLVHFYRDRWRPKGGPDGGDGGDGGSVYFKAVSDISKLSQFRFQKRFEAENGDHGGKNQRTGHGGKDLVVEVPVGTLVTYDNGTQIEFTKVGQTELMAKGGKGGRGNYFFRSATNQTPQEAETGRQTLAKSLHLQLKLIADVGLIGLPNAGKTSLLNELSNADAKVGSYAFTTLEPNLGVTKGGLIIADIPGLIEGASQGKGLGFKFLKHIERTRLIIHCLSSESQNPQKDIEIIRQELSSFSSNLTNKKELLVITKVDLVSPDKLTKIKKETQAVSSTSVLNTDSIKKLSDLITKTNT